MENSKCLRCQGEMAPGNLGPYSVTHFKPYGLPILASLGKTVPVQALMCVDCGHIELRGDLDQLRELLNR